MFVEIIGFLPDVLYIFIIPETSQDPPDKFAVSVGNIDIDEDVFFVK
jgi:hypothetical protein